MVLFLALSSSPFLSLTLSAPPHAFSLTLQSCWWHWCLQFGLPVLILSLAVIIMVISSSSLRRLADQISASGRRHAALKWIHIHAHLVSLFGCNNSSVFTSPLFHLSQGNITFSCAEPVFVAMTFTSPQSFLCLPGVTEPSSMGISVGLQFRTWNKAGLLLTFKLSKQGGAVWLYLSKARLHLQVHKSGRVPLELSTGQSDLKPPT